MIDMQVKIPVIVQKTKTPGKRTFYICQIDHATHTGAPIEAATICDFSSGAACIFTLYPLIAD